MPSSHCSRSAVTGSRPVSIRCSVSMLIAFAATSRNGRDGHPHHRVGVGIATLGGHRVRRRVSATLGYMTIVSTSTIVHTVSRCIVARSCAIGMASTVWARSAAKTRRASRSAPAAWCARRHRSRSRPGRAAARRRPRRVRAPGRRCAACRRSADGRCRSPGVSGVSRSRAGMRRGGRDPVWTQTQESRVKSRLGSGSMRKSSVASSWSPARGPPRTSSCGRPRQGPRQLARGPGRPAPRPVSAACRRGADRHHAGGRVLAGVRALQRLGRAGRSGRAPRRHGRAAPRRRGRARPGRG